MKSIKIALVSLFLSLTLVSVEAIGQTETGNGWVIRQGIDEKAGGPIVGGERKTIDGQNDVILMFAHSLKKSWVLVIHKGGIIPMNAYSVSKSFFGMLLSIDILKKMRMGNRLKIRYDNTTYKISLNGITKAMNLMLKNKNMYYTF